MSSSPTPIRIPRAHAPRPQGFSTAGIHAGADPVADAHGARVAPIYMSAGYTFEDPETARARFAGEQDGFVYSRVGNPTAAGLERRLAALEGGAGAIVVGSGQAAVANALLGLLGAGDRLLTSGAIYEGSRGLFTENFARLGVAVDIVDDADDPAAWRRALRPGTRALFAESISNPTNEVLDITAIADVAHGNGLPLVVDNTLATPYLLRPLEHGADIVVHSASKFLAGHGTALGGVIVVGDRMDWAGLGRSGEALFPHLVEPANSLGGRSWVQARGSLAYLEHTRHVVTARMGPTLSPFNAFLIQQGVETLSLRMAQHCSNASKLAGWLEEHPAVLRVDHASLASSPSAERAARYLPRGCGSVVAVTLHGGAPAAQAFLGALELFSHMSHLGDVRSLAVHPAGTTHAHRTEAERARSGVHPGTVRLSIGIEDVEDLRLDLEQALDAALIAAAAVDLDQAARVLGRSGMSREQHFGYFFARGFGPQGWGREDWRWGYDWTKPAIYQQAVRELEQGGFDLVVAEDAISLGNPDTLDLRVSGGYGGPKHDPLLLAPYLFAATEHIGIVPTVNAGITPPYLAARQAATLAHLSGDRFGINLVTDTGSARHVGTAPLQHDAAYDRAGEWMDVVRGLWNSWEDDALVADHASGRYADASRIRADRWQGKYFDVTGPLNAAPLAGGDPVVVSPGGSPRGLAFAGAYSDVQLALSPLDVGSIRAYRAKVHEAAVAAGRKPDDIRILFWVRAEIVATAEEARGIVAASREPDDAALLAIARAWSSDLETDVTAFSLDAPLPPDAFADHVSRGTIKGFLGGIHDPGSTPLREVLSRRARKGRLAEGDGLVGTAEEVADLVQELAEDADNDGVLFSGDMHPVSLHRLLDELVPALRARGLLRSSFGDGGLRGNLFDF